GPRGALCVGLDLAAGVASVGGARVPGRWMVVLGVRPSLGALPAGRVRAGLDGGAGGARRPPLAGGQLALGDRLDQLEQPGAQLGRNSSSPSLVRLAIAASSCSPARPTWVSRRAMVCGILCLP